MSVSFVYHVEAETLKQSPPTPPYRGHCCRAKPAPQSPRDAPRCDLRRPPPCSRLLFVRAGSQCNDQAIFSDYFHGLNSRWGARTEIPGHVTTTLDPFRHARLSGIPHPPAHHESPELLARVPAPKSTHLWPAKLISDLFRVRQFATLSIAILRLWTQWRRAGSRQAALMLVPETRPPRGSSPLCSSPLRCQEART